MTTTITAHFPPFTSAKQEAKYTQVRRKASRSRDKEVVAIPVDGRELIRTFPSVREAAKFAGVEGSTMSSRIQNKGSVGGYYWRFK